MVTMLKIQKSTNGNYQIIYPKWLDVSGLIDRINDHPTLWAIDAEDALIIEVATVRAFIEDKAVFTAEEVIALHQIVRMFSMESAPSNWDMMPPNPSYMLIKCSRCNKYVSYPVKVVQSLSISDIRSVALCDTCAYDATMNFLAHKTLFPDDFNAQFWNYFSELDVNEEEES